jgi:hypothetical protein
MEGASKYELFDRAELDVRPLSERTHDLDLSNWLRLNDPTPAFTDPQLGTLARRIGAARDGGSARILVIGGHVLRAGVSRHIIDLMERGFVDHLAMNGACMIHDYELARIGATTESVPRYISTGQFGLWRETGELNDLIVAAATQSRGMGEAVGGWIESARMPHGDLSVLAAAWRLSIPATVHVGIGYDILHEHPNCCGAATGQASYTDFLIFARAVQRLEGGVLLSFGSAVMAPEVYLKALAMARNVARQTNRSIRDIATAVFDLLPLAGDVRSEPPKTEAAYYFRPRKTILVRTVADGGFSYYFCGPHRATIPALRRALLEAIA